MAKGLKKLFAKKPGGTLFGNLLRAGSSIAASALGGPIAGKLVSSLLPAAPPSVSSLASQLVGSAISMPVQNTSEIKWLASEAKQQVYDAGGSEEEASKVGAAVYTAASLPPAQAVQALDSATPQLANSFTSGDAKKILNKAVDGLQTGIMDGVMETEEGKKMKKAAINAQGEKFMPWVLGVLAGVFGLLLIFKKK